MSESATPPEGPGNGFLKTLKSSEAAGSCLSMQPPLASLHREMVGAHRLEPGAGNSSAGHGGGIEKLLLQTELLPVLTCF